MKLMSYEVPGIRISMIVSMVLMAGPLSAQAGQAPEEIVVRGSAALFSDVSDFSPTARITADELEGVNFNTLEDGIQYEPSITVRRRFVGDPNGTLGIRGSNMFQGPRTMVFADGLPLHYHLQARWNGSPRWSLVAPDETRAVNVVYGPFSAEYSGNAMGGVVNIETRMPEEETFDIQGTFFQQDYDVLGTDEDFTGGRQFVAYGNRWGNLSVYAFYNRLRNDSQPMDQYFGRASPANGDERQVSGGIPGVDVVGEDVVWFGDSGAEVTDTNLYKTKIEYEMGRYMLRGTVAFEQRDRAVENKNNFLTTTDGEPVWSGPVAMDDRRFTVGGQFGNPFEAREQERNSLLLGAGLSGPVGESGWYFDSFATDFDIRKDQELRSARNPRDPEFDGSGRVTEFDDTGWNTFDLKFSREGFGGLDTLQLSTGYHFSRYTLGLFEYDSDDFRSAERTSPRGRSGGEMQTQALYVQSQWAFAPRWDLGLGLRYEDWEASDGFIDDERFSSRSDSAFSPKFSLGYELTPEWSLRYSLARAVRFPVVEELFQSLDAGTTAQISNPGLAPEEGIHHNLRLERLLPDGSLTLNLFTETVDDVIFAQRGIVDGVDLNTFLPVDRVRTDGAELTYNQRDLLGTPLSLRFNTSYIKAIIRENRVNPSVEGNEFPRMPRWRVNALLSYPLTADIDVSGGVRYSGNHFNNLANDDVVDNVFGAMDSFTFVNLRANWEMSEQVQLSFGVDNLTNEEAYVHHPWPFRTLFLEGSWHL